MKIAETSQGALYLASAHKLPLADKSVHCVTSSPPYFGLRKYSGEQDVVWIGGEYLPMTGATAPIVIPGPRTWEEVEACEHDFSREFHPPGYRGSDTNPGAIQHDGNKNRDRLGGHQCSKCGALRCAFGSEEKVEWYIFHSLLILRELRRVLRDDGVVFFNLGDSYASGAGVQRAISCGNDGRVLEGCLDGGLTSQSPCDVPQASHAESKPHISRCISVKSDPLPCESSREHKVISHGHLPTLHSFPEAVHTKDANQVSAHLPNHEVEQPSVSQASTLAASSLLSLESPSSPILSGYPSSSLIENRGVLESSCKTASQSLTCLSRGEIQEKTANNEGSKETGGALEGHTADKVFDSDSHLHSSTEYHQRQAAIPPGNLIGVPHRLMLAAQADGWTVRNDLIWGKVSCLPESVSGVKWERHRIKREKSQHPRSQEGNKPLDSHHPGQVPHRDGAFDQPYDTKWVECPGCEKCSSNNGYILKRGAWRHTRSHEYVFHLTKSMDYWTDSEVVKEQAKHAGDNRKARAKKDHKTHPEAERGGVREGETSADLSKRNPRNVLYVESSKAEELSRLLEWLSFEHPEILHELEESIRTPDSIIRPSPSGYTGHHFAVFPPDLIRGLIKSATPLKCCPHCGAGWSPVVERTNETPASHKGSGFDVGKTGINSGDRVQEGPRTTVKSNGVYRQTCACPPHEPVAGTVLDAFFGSGTTGVVAREIGVKFIGCDISREYLENQAMDRALRVTPSKKIEELPLFSGKQE